MCVLYSRNIKEMPQYGSGWRSWQGKELTGVKTTKVRSHAGKRKDLGDIYFRSATEANYARYLNLAKIKWEFEPRTFYFEGVRRGNVSYTPDFYLPNEDRWIEIKGWLDGPSKTKLKRFKKYYPEEFAKLTVVLESPKDKDLDALEKIGIVRIESFKEIRNKLSRVIKGWEGSFG